MRIALGNDVNKPMLVSGQHKTAAAAELEPDIQDGNGFEFASGIYCRSYRVLPMGGSRDASVIGLSVLLAPFLWFWVGKWVDRQLGTAGHKPDRRRSRIVLPGELFEC